MGNEMILIGMVFLVQGITYLILNNLVARIKKLEMKETARELRFL